MVYFTFFPDKRTSALEGYQLNTVVSSREAWTLNRKYDELLPIMIGEASALFAIPSGSSIMTPLSSAPQAGVTIAPAVLKSLLAS